MESFSIFLRTKATHNYRLNQQYKKYYRILRTHIYFLKPGGLLPNLKIPAFERLELTLLLLILSSPPSAHRPSRLCERSGHC